MNCLKFWKIPRLTKIDAELPQVPYETIWSRLFPNRWEELLEFTLVFLPLFFVTLMSKNTIQRDSNCNFYNSTDDIKMVNFLQRVWIWLSKVNISISIEHFYNCFTSGTFIIIFIVIIITTIIITLFTVDWKKKKKSYSGTLHEVATTYTAVLIEIN